MSQGNSDGFDGFSQVVERMCFNGWRAALGIDTPELLDDVNSVMLTRSHKPNRWEFSFCLRIGKRWHQAVAEVPPVEFDVFEDTFTRPKDIAMGLVDDLLTKVRKDIEATYADR